MKILSYACHVISCLLLWTVFLSGFDMIQKSNGRASFITEPLNERVKTGSTVTFLWIYEDTREWIEKGELFLHIGGKDFLLFKVNPNDNTSAVFDPMYKVGYLKRVNITVPEPLKFSRVSAQMVLSNVTTDYTGFYSFKIIDFEGTAWVSNVSLYVTESPHSLTMNITQPDNITKDVGESLYVECHVSGAPVPTVTWISRNIKHKVISGSNSAVLSLNNVTKQHKGTYICKANNSEGEVESSISLKVIYLELTCTELRFKDKSLVKLTAVGYPTPLCTQNRTKINCETTVELNRKNPDVLLTARNTAGLERSCLKTDTFGQPSSSVHISYSKFLVNSHLIFTAFILSSAL